MIEADGLDSLLADLTAAPGRAQWAARGVVEKGAANVKRDARQFASGIGHAPHYPASITYDITHVGDGRIEAEIGPDKKLRQGALGNVLEYGTSKNAPLAHLGPALDIEGPRFERAMGDLDDGLQ